MAIIKMQNGMKLRCASEVFMVKWIDYTATAKNPPRNRALLVYCPDWCDIGYAVVTWNGANFEDEMRGEDIHDYVKKWCLIFEAD